MQIKFSNSSRDQTAARDQRRENSKLFLRCNNPSSTQPLFATDDEARIFHNRIQIATKMLLFFRRRLILFSSISPLSVIATVNLSVSMFPSRMQRSKSYIAQKIFPSNVKKCRSKRLLQLLPLFFFVSIYYSVSKPAVAVPINRSGGARSTQKDDNAAAAL